ncbi:hypothetical protein NBRC13296_12550 [Paenibacillus chitinolyticus]|uniref:hypothetical protein n=1 Tax=Paenibacillus chitinolyticus TaxID=79263 RepID=UPI003556D7DF
MDMNKDVKQLLYKMLNEVNIYPTDEQIAIVNRGRPHKCTFKQGKMYVYTFSFNEDYLKIGKAGSNSKARFYSQHYNPESSQSNLAKSIILDPAMEFYSLSSSTVGDWIKNNVDRIDIEIDAKLGVFTLNLIESILHCLYLPRYEGFKTQRADKM